MGAGSPTRGNPNTFLFSLVQFCAETGSTCFSHDADKLCVPIGLTFLSAIILLLSCFLLVYQRCTSRGESRGEATTLVYSLLGNLCGVVGAVQSRQLYIQVLMGAVAAATDAVRFVSCCLPVLLCWNSKEVRRRRTMRRRRRQHLLAVCVLMVVAGGFLQSRVTDLPANRPLSGRRLQHITLQDNSEILGYVLGLLSCVIVCTSRFPTLCRAYRGQMLTRAFVFSALLCSLAGSLYAAAILLHNTHFGFLLRVMPWLLSAICCVILDLLVPVVHWCKRGTRQQRTSFSPDTESLLGGSHIPIESKAVLKMQKKQQVHPSAQTKIKNVQKMTEMGRYMDVSVQPARKPQICLQEVMSEQEEAEVENHLLNREVRVIRVNSFCSSDTSYDSSLVSSDLEWDFEEANAHWNESTAKQQLPPERWPANSKTFNICTCTMSGLSQKTLSGTEDHDCLSSASLAK
uniref:transmembrane protein 44 isoform X1 n=1 Tax=Scatophagus argus TaxID=75038 RepID=UPI001ED8173A|nr:transmembrane protein 44 isoform X1 [Scatophagus argus]